MNQGYLPNRPDSCVQKEVLLKDFNSFAAQQTDILCNHIETYIREQGCTLTYLNSGQTDKGGFACQCYEQFPYRTGLVCALSVVEPCKTMTVKPNRATKNSKSSGRHRDWLTVYPIKNYLILLTEW